MIILRKMITNYYFIIIMVYVFINIYPNEYFQNYDEDIYFLEDDIITLTNTIDGFKMPNDQKDNESEGILIAGRYFEIKKIYNIDDKSNEDLDDDDHFYSWKDLWERYKDEKNDSDSD